MFKNKIYIYIYIFIFSISSLIAMDDIGQVEDYKKIYIKAVELEEAGNIKDSIKHFKKSAKLGHHRSAYILAHKYLSGDGVKQSGEKGIKYLVIAKESGSSKAREQLDQLSLSMDDLTQYIPEPSWVKLLRSTSKVSRTIDSICYYTQLIGEFGCIALNVLEYKKEAETLEYILKWNQGISGVSKITYGVTESIITRDVSKLLYAGIGAIQIGSVYLQHQSEENLKKIKLEKEKAIKEKYDCNEKIKKLDDKSDEFEKLWCEIEEKNKRICCIEEDEVWCDAQTLGTICAEEILNKTLVKYSSSNKNDNFLLLLSESTVSSLLKTIPRFIIRYTKDEKNKHKIREKVISFVDGVKQKISIKGSSYLDIVCGRINENVDQFLPSEL